MKNQKAKKKFEIGFSRLTQNLYKEAILAFNECIEIDKSIPEVYSNRGIAYNNLGLYKDAVQDYLQAIKLKSNFAEAMCNLGVTYNHLEQYQNAADQFIHALKIQPKFPAALINFGISLRNLSRFDDAHEQFNIAFHLEPQNELIPLQQGITYFAQKNYEKAFESYDQALIIKPNFSDALLNAAEAFIAVKNPSEAIKIFDQLILIDPKVVTAYVSKYEALNNLKKYEEALEAISQALTIEPELTEGIGKLMHLKSNVCDWKDFNRLHSKLLDGIMNEKHVTQPLVAISLIDDPGILKKSAIFHSGMYASPSASKNILQKYCIHDKIRLGFFSSDFQEHPIAHLMTELFEKFDRSRFEITAFSFGEATDEDIYKARLKKAFDEFIDIKDLKVNEVVKISMDREIDIAIDLNGYTGNCRTDLFATRVAPIQMQYLGFLGTMGANFMDYIIADNVLIPIDHQANYSEKIVYLPSYQPNDSQRKISTQKMNRSDFGLRDDDFVFCCLNNTYKILPDFFDGWMRILKKTSNSVLWLRDNGEFTSQNIQKEARSRGVDPKRIIFAKSLPIPEYLARFQLADIFLDTFPYNAGTVGSDALRMGLPLITLCGNTFSSRMAASLLHSVNLPELITYSTKDYESLAIELCQDKVKYVNIKGKLSTNLPKSKLFDIDKYTRHIESAFTNVYNRLQNNEDPEHIFITD
jgi:tetratricopeptide (TPR) repeat protein